MGIVKSRDTNVVSGPPTVRDTAFGHEMPKFLEGYDSLPGTWGAYKVLQPIGTGGMASVFLGEHETEHPVAVKFASKQELDGFIVREYFALHAISHPNVVSVYDGGIINSRKFLVMERLKGCTLYSKLWENGALDPETAVQVAIEILKGAEAAHSIGLIHSDIKSENVFLHETPTKLTIKLIDFGLCTNTEEASLNQRSFGTTGFMSPEQAMAKAFDIRSDLYSIGAILYEMLTKRLPFSGTWAEVLQKTMSDQPMPLSTMDPRIPQVVSDIVMTALEKDPGRRFQCASEFRLALEAAFEAI